MANYTETFTSVNGDVTDAAELETEFDAIATAIASKIDSDGSGTMTGALNMGSNKITNLTDPTSNQEGATKLYADSNFMGAAAGDEFLARLASTPAGWAVSAVNDKAVKIVTGTPSTDGGSIAFSTALVNAHATVIATEAAHTHAISFTSGTASSSFAGVSSASGPTVTAPTHTHAVSGTSAAGSAHRHTITLGVQHREFNIFVKS